MTTWLVVLDDDPTGCQSVSGIPLLWKWDRADLLALAHELPLATFLLTNSRSLPPADAVRIAGETTALLVEVAAEAGVDLRIISRSDSTLRGHFPAEVDAVADALGEGGLHVDGIVLAPCFIEAGRYTIDDVQLVRRGTDIVPAARTEFAHDAAFGYSELDLRSWAAARMARPVETVRSIGLRTIWEGGPQGVADVLAGLQDRQVVVANAASFDDLAVLAAGIEIAESAGRRFVYRTGPSFVRARAGLPAPPLVAAGELAYRDGFGLIVVGSHTTVTSQQLERLLAGEHGPNDATELDVASLLDPSQRAAEIERCATEVAATIRSGTALLATSRHVQHGDSAAASLTIASEVAAAVVEVAIAATRDVPPAWVLAKGGITSHDIA
ncbi:MAG: four-carbon acid sugar kinase family protein, partial [Ilumatobacteraceae bacterium]